MISGAAVGILVGIEESGVPLIIVPGMKTDIVLPARSTVALDASHAGSEVALVFEAGELTKPIILGCIQPQSTLACNAPVKANLDGKKIILSADKELSLTCGKASITLTNAGKVLIHGEYVLTDSAGVNRIRGGSVQIN